MRKSILSSILVAGCLFAATLSVKSQACIVDEAATCVNWSEDIHQFASEKEKSGTISMVYDSTNNLKATVSWDEKSVKVDNVLFDLGSKQFTQNGQAFKAGRNYFDKLYKVWGCTLKIYKKGIYSPDFKKS